MSKILAVGDVHQKRWILDRVEKLMDDYDKIVFVGDYLDDFGATPMDRFDMICKIKSFYDKYPDKIVLIRGNHDLCYSDNRYAGLYTGWDSSAHFLINSNRDIKNFMNDGLVDIATIDGIIYSHAGLTDDWFEGRDPMSEDGHMWVRPSLGYVYKSGQVFGHTPSVTCWEVQKDVWCIDTF